MVSFDFVIQRYMHKKTGEFTAHLLFGIDKSQFEFKNITLNVKSESSDVISCTDANGRDFRKELTHAEFFTLQDMIEENEAK